jgi:adenylosuccinate lyase
MIEKHLQEELPFLATENILMEAVKRGKDRQELHEKLRQHSLAASRRIKEEGLSSDLLDRISKDPSFGLSTSDLNQIVNIEQFIGRAPEQVDEFLKSEVFPILKKYEGMQVFIPPLEI